MKIAAVAVALAYLASFVAAADEDTTMNIGMTSDKAMTPGLRGASLYVPAGVITNTIDAKNNDVRVTKSNIVLSKSDRVQLTTAIKEMLASHPEANLEAANLMLEQLEPDNNPSTTARVATNPAVISNAVNIIASVLGRNPAAAVGHTVGMIGAAYPVITGTPPQPVTPLYIPSRVITMSPSARGVDTGTTTDTTGAAGPASPTS
ncbi:hypothetical protein PF005_g15241 [Phytophthora fragariae]|uniref:RxLR effector protein n=1 Tax=Phytophthora fragariae TaxID=53985 RepID=A0A6A3EU04_9STRA|nr:hypothetical protein PF003_g1109 [Phytophthora fragariae]KAE8933498.1 hypothetical protein PF009_g16497 [Phytophthora fragariae]KAE9014951.1 hypothetical protein PF011_g7832 [Phytophthora fragariae]KAE9100331.1 hypothetical protein PF007_g15562 [Phytophthora fragariae]KAE9115562.1 hypothetical protein PF010_g9276 [Phytophthora fragariae]